MKNWKREIIVRIANLAILALLVPIVSMLGVTEPGEAQDFVVTEQSRQSPGDTATIGEHPFLTPEIKVDSVDAPADFSDSFYYRKLDNVPFRVGERLRYVVRYGIISAGSAELKIPEAVLLNGRDCYHIISEIRSGRFFSAFFRVRDHLESFIDVDGIYPWMFEKQLREGKYRADVRASYDHGRGLAFVNQDTVRIPPFVQDVLSVFYYVRTQPLAVGKSIIVDNNDNKKVFALELRVLREERVKVRAGEFKTLVVEPFLKATGEQAGLFREKGRAWIWFTADEWKIPVLIKSKVSFGSLVLELKEMEGVGGAW